MKETTKRMPKKGIGLLATETIRDGKTNEQVLKVINEKYPNAKTSLGSIAGYRSILRKNGENVRSNGELKKGVVGKPANKGRTRSYRRYPDAEKRRFITAVAQGKGTIASRCEKEGISQGKYYKWVKEFPNAGKKSAAGGSKKKTMTSKAPVQTSAMKPSGGLMSRLLALFTGKSN